MVNNQAMENVLTERGQSIKVSGKMGRFMVMEHIYFLMEDIQQAIGKKAKSMVNIYLLIQKDSSLRKVGRMEYRKNQFLFEQPL